MPRIIVLADCGHGPARRIVMEERVVSAYLESDHASAQLVERPGWAILDISGSTHTSAVTEAHVDEMLGQGATLAEVEEFIERQPISEEYRAVLWLRAWTETADGGSRTRLRRTGA